MHEHDPLEFAAALVAIWERGDCAWLPGDDRPGSLAPLASRTRARLGDIEQGYRPGMSHPPCWGEDFSPQRIALSLYTSGSTGQPQRIDKTFAQLQAELTMHADFWPLENRLVISQVSHQHIYGLLFAILRPLFEHAPIALTPCRYPERLNAILTHLSSSRTVRPSTAVLISAPPPLERLPTHLTWHDAARSLHRVHSSGAPLTTAASQHAFQLLNTPIQEIYGSSETGGIAWRDQQMEEVWCPFPGVEVHKDDTGLLYLRSPFLASNGWERQADRLRMVENGRFQLLGRADRIAKVGGKRLSLTAMDQSLATHPKVVFARTVELPDRRHRLGVIVQPTSDSLPHDHNARHALIGSLRAHLSSTYPSTVVPRYWRFVDDWPSNSQGKLTAPLIVRLFRDLDDTRLPRWLGSRFSSADHCDIQLEIPERLRYLRGHFPGNPVVPGVVIIQWVIALAHEEGLATGTFQRMERVRFMQLLLPGDRASLSLDKAETPSGLRLTFTLSGERGRHANGQIYLTPLEPGDDE